MAESSDETAGHHANASTLHLHPDKTQIGKARRFVRQTLRTGALAPRPQSSRSPQANW